MTEPGQPCVMISGSAFSCGDLTWMKWMSRPSISVMNCGNAFSLASDAPEVVLAAPVARERLHRRELHALRLVRDGLLLGPARGRDAPAEVVQLLLGDIDLEGADLCGTRGLIGGDGHVASPLGLVTHKASWDRSYVAPV